MNSHNDINDLRHFALIVGVLFLIYSLSGIEINTTENVTFVGISISILRPELIGISFFIISIYATVRYYIYGIAIGLHPRAARKHIYEGTLADGNNYSNNIDEFRVLAKKDIEKYFPVLEPPNEIKWSIEEIDNHFKINIVVGRIAKIFGLIHDFDFYLPILINLLAMLLFWTI